MKLSSEEKKKKKEHIKRPFPGCYNAHLYMYYIMIILSNIYLQQNYCVNKLLSIFIE